MTDLSSIRQELEKSRRDVLDLSLRNPLLNFRPTKRRGIEVVDERSRELFRILVGGPVPDGSSSRSPRVMYFLPASAETALPATGEPARDDLGDIPSELLAMLDEPDDGLDEAAARHTDNKLQTALPRAALNLRPRETFRHARLSIEEQGVNILYLALGMLRWYESESSSTERRAPLILIPVQLTRSSVRENFKLKWTGDDIEANLSLEARLKQDFGIRLPEMPRRTAPCSIWTAACRPGLADQRRRAVRKDPLEFGVERLRATLTVNAKPRRWRPDRAL